MPKKGIALTPREQSARFRAEVDRMVEAGDINISEAAAALERVVAAASIRRTKSHPGNID